MAATTQPKMSKARSKIAVDDLDVYSEKSPLGGAVHGQTIGATVSYTAPNGREISVTIKAAEYL